MLTNTERDNILRSLFLKDGELDSSFLYKWKWAELYAEISRDKSYPFIDIEVSYLKNLRHKQSFKKILGKTDFITDVWSWDWQKAVALLKWLPRKWTYIPEDYSREMLDIAEKKVREELPQIKLWSSQKLNNGKHLSWDLPNNMYLFLWWTICNMSDEQIIDELKNMDNNWILTWNRILLSYFTAPDSQEEINKLIEIYNSPANKKFHENGIDMLWLSKEDFEYDTIYQKDNPSQKEWPFPWRIKWIIKAKKNTTVMLSNWKKIKIKQWQEFTLHYSRRFTKEQIEDLFKKSGCKTKFTNAKEGVSISLLSKKPMKTITLINKYKKNILSILISLWVLTWSTHAAIQISKSQQENQKDEQVSELIFASRWIENHTQEINQLVYALKLDELWNKKDKQIIFNLFNKYIDEHRMVWTSTENLIKWFYNEYWLTLIKDLGVTHSPYDFMKPSSISITKNVKNELSITPPSVRNDLIKLPEFQYDYWEFSGIITNQEWIFNPDYTFEYNDWWEKYLILQATINKWGERIDIYLGTKKTWEKYPTFSTKTITNTIQDKSWLDPKIVLNTNKLWGNFINKGKIHVGNTNFTLTNTNEDMIIKTTNISASIVKPDCLYLSWKIYFIIKVPTASWKEILLASESIHWPFSISNFKKIANEFCVAWDIPVD